MKITINNIEYDAITDLNDLTIVQFMKLEPLIVKEVNDFTEDFISLRISEVLCNVENEFFDELPIQELSKINTIINGINASSLKPTWPTHKIIEDTLYVFKQRQDGFTTGEMASLKVLLSRDMDPIMRALNMLALIVRPGTSEIKEGKTFYKQERLDTHPLTIDNRVEVFKTGLKWYEVDELLGFFLTTIRQYLVNMNSSMGSQTSLKKQPVKKVKSGKATSKKQV